MVGLVRAVFGFARADRSGTIGRPGAALARTDRPYPACPQDRIANIRAVFPEKVGRGCPGHCARGLGQSRPDRGRISASWHPCSISIRTAPFRAERKWTASRHFLALRDDGKPGIIFSAHLGNWELPAICAARFGLDATAVFRAPNDPAIARVLHEIRSGTMGGLEAARQGAAFAMQGALEKGRHLGMLIDQHFTRGVIVDFMGRPALVNPILGKFARRFDCPVHGVRVIRLPDHRFRLQLTPASDASARPRRSGQRAGRHAGDDAA